MELDNKISNYQLVFNKLVDQQNTIQLKHIHEWYIFQDKKNDIYSKLEKDVLDQKLTRLMKRHHDYISLSNLRDLLNPFPEIVYQIDKELIRMEKQIIDRIETLYHEK